MSPVFGYILIIAAIIIAMMAFRRPAPGQSASTPADASRKTYFLVTAVGCLLVGIYLSLSPALAVARMRTVPVGHPELWHTKGDVKVDRNRIDATLGVGSDAYALIPVDWNGVACELRWNMTIHQLDIKQAPNRAGETLNREVASIAVGLTDVTGNSIDDRDHISASGLQACFSDDVRLRAADSNFILKTASSTEAGKLNITDFKKTEPVVLKTETPYSCELSYRASATQATLTVREKGGPIVVQRKLEDMNDFTTNVAWLGVTVKGYNRYDKQAEIRYNRQREQAARAGKEMPPYPKPVARVTIENLQYRQP